MVNILQRKKSLLRSVLSRTLKYANMLQKCYKIKFTAYENLAGKLRYIHGYYSNINSVYFYRLI